MVGIDEVGRGCWAGPLLVVAARQGAELPLGLKDSKQLSRKQRSELLELLSISCDFGEGWVKPSEVDSLGLSKALRLGALRALRGLQVSRDEAVILDGSFNYLPKKFTNSQVLITGDKLLPIISAASVYAKVTRDNYMLKLAKKYPNYKFETHVGYGTKAHMLALKTHGALKYIHRSSFSPISNLNREVSY